ILAFNVESEPETEAIARVAKRVGKKAPIALRVNPDVDAATHHYITTGRKENKFGIALSDIRKLMGRLAESGHLELIGLHAHIGSQILKPEPYIEALGRLRELLETLRSDGHDIRLL